MEDCEFVTDRRPIEIEKWKEEEEVMPELDYRDYFDDEGEDGDDLLEDEDNSSQVFHQPDEAQSFVKDGNANPERLTRAQVRKVERANDAQARSSSRPGSRASYKRKSTNTRSRTGVGLRGKGKGKGKSKGRFQRPPTHRLLSRVNLNKLINNKQVSNNLQPTDDNPLFEQLCLYETLREAWHTVRRGRTQSARRSTSAADRVSLEFYERHLEKNLSRLSYHLRNGSYRPRAINQFRLPKPGGGHRVLAVLTIDDRIAQRAALGLIEPLFEPDFLPTSFAYRPDRGVQAALEEVERNYANGYRYVVDGDIESFFDRIDRSRLLTLLAQKIADQRLLALLQLWLDYTPVLNAASLTSTVDTVIAEQKKKKKKTGAEVEPEPPSGLNQLFEEGLHWGLERLGGTTRNGRERNRYSQSKRYSYSPPSKWWELEETDEDVSSDQQTYPSYDEEVESNYQRSLIRRIGVDGAWLGLSVARQLLKRGLPHSSGLGAIGVALGAAGAIGAGATIARKIARQRPSLYEVETGNYLLINGLASPALETTYGETGPLRLGIAQGSVLSPFYSNVYLHDFDVQMARRGCHLVRFADDLLIMCRSQKEAFGALHTASAILRSMGLTFKPSKTRVCPIGEGFSFLGAEFGKDGLWKSPPIAIGTRLVASESGTATQSQASWLSRASRDWLKHTSRQKPGIIQQGKVGIRKNKKPLEN